MNTTIVRQDSIVVKTIASEPPISKKSLMIVVKNVSIIEYTLNPIQRFKNKMRSMNYMKVTSLSFLYVTCL